MGLFALAAGFISSIGSVVSTAVSSVGSALSSFASTVAPVIGNIFSKIPSALEKISDWGSAIGTALNIFKADENVMDIGDRALQAANSEQEIKPEKFDSFDEYMNALRNFELDPEKSNKTHPVIKVVTGLGVTTLGMEEKFNLAKGSLNEIWVLPMTNPEYFNPERIKMLLESGKGIDNVITYMERRMNADNATKFEENLEITADGKPMNDTELGKLYDALDSARTEWADLNQQLKGND